MVDTTPTKRLMLVDDHSIVRTGMRRIFKDCPDLVVDCEANDGQEALELLRTRPVDAVLLDLSMPGRSGMEVLGRMRVDRPELPILVVSMHEERQFVVPVLKAGASGYVSKGKASDEIIDAIRTVLDGRRYLSEGLADELASVASTGDDVTPHERLSPREFDVFCHLASGKSVSAVAEVLFISVKTVSTHRAHILKKMGHKTNSDMTSYAIRNALME